MNQEEYEIKLGSKATVVSIVCESFENHSSESETEAGLREFKELLANSRHRKRIISLAEEK